MKRLCTFITVLLIWAITDSLALEPIRISVATNLVDQLGVITIDVLDESGIVFVPALSYEKAEERTDNGGVLSFVLDDADASLVNPHTPWTDLTFNKNYLVRVTFDPEGAVGPVVLSIERMEVMYAKQGLFGTTIDPAEIEPSANGNVLATNSLGVTSWQPATEVLKSATMNWFFMPSVMLDVTNPNNGVPRTANLYANFTAQFTDPMYKNASAPGDVLSTLPTASDFYYYITYYDNTVFEIQSLSDLGVLTYKVIGTPTEATFVNIVFVLH